MITRYKGKPLRGCPFCAVVPRAGDVTDTPDDLVAVQCHDCGAVGPHAENELAAVERWNDRRSSSLLTSPADEAAPALPKPVRL